MRPFLLSTLLLAASLPAATKTIASSALQLVVTPSPYSYQVIERSTGQVLVSENAMTFTIAGVPYQAATAGGIITTPTSVNATLTLIGSTETAHVQFVFTSPQVLQIQLTANGSAPTSSIRANTSTGSGNTRSRATWTIAAPMKISMASRTWLTKVIRMRALRST